METGEQGKVVQLICPLCDHWRGNGGGCSGKEHCDAFDLNPSAAPDYSGD